MGHGREAYFWALLGLPRRVPDRRPAVAPTGRPPAGPSAADVVVVGRLPGAGRLVLSGRRVAGPGLSPNQERGDHARARVYRAPRSQLGSHRARRVRGGRRAIGNLVAFARHPPAPAHRLRRPRCRRRPGHRGQPGLVALDLARRNRKFLVGQEASPAIRRRLAELIATQPGITGVGQLLVTFLGPRRLWVLARIELDDALTGSAVAELLRATERAVQAQSPAIARVDLVPRGRA